MISRATKRSPLALAAAAALVACGGRPAATAADAPFSVEPLRLVIVRGDREATVMTLDAAGALTEERAVVAHLHDGRIDRPDGAAWLTVAVGGEVSFDRRDTPLRFTSKDDVVANNGRRIAIAEDGSVVFSPPWKKSRGYSFRVDGVHPKSKKTALLVLVFFVLEHAESDDDD